MGVSSVQNWHMITSHEREHGFDVHTWACGHWHDQAGTIITASHGNWWRKFASLLKRMS